MASHIYESITVLFPKKYVVNFRQWMIYAGIKKDVSELLGKTLLISIILGILLSVIMYMLNLNVFLIVAGFICFILIVQFFVYIFVYFKMDSRKSEIEKTLPDALQLIASNLQAGMTPYRAIKVSARKEFGALSEELNIATSHALGTKSFSEELMKIGKRVDSNPLRRTLKLITNSMQSGGHLASLLEELSEDIAETQSLKNEMITNTKTYIMFIMFTIIVGAPLLLSISVHFVGMVQNMQGQTTLSTDEFGLGFLSGEIDITPDFLTKVSFVTLFFTSLLACMLTGVITKGEMKAGLKYSPFIIFASIALFFVAKMIIGSFFSSMT